MAWRRVTAWVAGLALSAASVVDNPASCPEGAPWCCTSTGVPYLPDDSCAGACDTPGVRQDPFEPWPVVGPGGALALACPEPQSADEPPPPTPPPTA